MNFVETAKKIICSVIAVALAMSVAAVEALLPNKPEWLERVNELSIQLRIVASGGQAAAGPKRAAAPTVNPSEPAPAQEADIAEDRAGTIPEIDPDRLLLAYNQLWQFVHGVRSDGLALDDKFCERVEREWTVSTLLSYVRNADKSLQEKAGASMESASTFLATATSDTSKST